MLPPGRGDLDERMTCQMNPLSRAKQKDHTDTEEHNGIQEFRETMRQKEKKEERK